MAENLDDFIAGWVSGAVATILTQPFDMAVTRMQASGQTAPLAHLRSLMRLDYSVGAAWRGVGPLLIGTPFNNALCFLGYGMGKRFAETGDETPNRCASPPRSLTSKHQPLSRPPHARSLWPIFVGGCAGGFAQSFTASPVELLKVRLQLSEPKSVMAGAGGLAAAGGRGFATASSIVKELTAVGHSHSLPPLFSQGLLATLARDVVPHGVWFAAYECAKTTLTPERPPPLPASLGGAPVTEEPLLSTARQLAAGTCAAVAAWGVGYPFDIIKTRCQMSTTALGFAGATQQVGCRATPAQTPPPAARYPRHLHLRFLETKKHKP